MALNLGELVAYLKLDDKSFDGTLDRLPTKIQGAGKGAFLAGGIVGAGVAAALTKGVFDAVNMEASNNKVAAQLGLTAAESARVGTLAGSVYAQNYGDSVEQVQQTIGAVVTQIKGMGTASDSTVEGMTAKVLNYSSAFGGETSEAIALVQQLMENGLATSADHAMDLLTASMQQVPEALRGDMTDAITEYGPFLASLGYSGEEAFGLLAKGAEKGMYGIDKTGDALKEFTIRSSDMSAASKVGFDLIGMSQEEMTNKLLAGGDTATQAFDQIVAGIEGLEDPAAKSQAALALFGTPLEDLGVQDIPAFLESLAATEGGLENVAGSADRMGEQLGAGVGAGFETVKRQAEMLMAGLGTQLLPVLQSVMDFLAGNPEVIAMVATALGALAVAWGVVTAAMWLLSLTPVMLTITLIIAGIGALVAAIVWLVTNWTEVTGFLTTIWQGFTDWLMGVLGALGDWWTGFWNTISAWVSSVWTGFIGFIVGVFTGFWGWLQGIGAAISAWWTNLWTSVGTFVRNAWTGFTTFVRAVFDAYVAYLRGVGSAISSWWTGLWSGVGAFIQSTWSAFTGFVRGVFDGFFGALSAVGAALSGWWSGLWSGVASFVTSTWTMFTNAVRNYFMDMLNGFQIIGATLSGWWSGLWSGVASAASAVWSAIVGFIGGFVGSIVGNIRSGFSGAASFLSGIWSGISGTVQSTWSGIMSFLGGLPGRILGVFSGFGSLLSGMGRNLIDGLLNGIKAAAGRVFDFIGGIGDKIASTFANVLDIHSPSRVFYGFGLNTVQGYMDAVAKMTPDLDRQMEELVKTPELSMSSRQVATTGDTGTTQAARHITYVAAENQSLSSEEALFAALGSPRVGA
jgi:phage-related minor tail protein